MWDGVLGRLSALLGRDRFEQELDEELRFHLEMETQKNVELGMSSREARDVAPVLVLSYDYWKRSHRGDQDVVGMMLEMNDRPHRVVGVLPPFPQFPNDNDVYMPVSSCPFHTDPSFMANRTERMMSVFGKMKEGVALEDAIRDLDLVAETIRKTNPSSYPESQGYAVTTTLLRDELTRQARPTLLLLLATASFVLLIACANVANINLSRLVKRQRELVLLVVAALACWLPARRATSIDPLEALRPE